MSRRSESNDCIGVSEEFGRIARSIGSNDMPIGQIAIISPHSPNLTSSLGKGSSAQRNHWNRHKIDTTSPSIQPEWWPVFSVRQPRFRVVSFWTGCRFPGRNKLLYSRPSGLHGFRCGSCYNTHAPSGLDEYNFPQNLHPFTAAWISLYLFL